MGKVFWVTEMPGIGLYLPPIGDIDDIERVSATRAQAKQRTCTVRMLGAGERASIRLGPGFVAAMGTKQTPEK